MTLTITPPPLTPIESVSEILHGVKVIDPYRWLENQNSPRTREWLKEQNAYTRAYLDNIPGRECIRKRVAELLAVETVSDPWKVRNRYFFLKRKPYQEQPILMMREGEVGDDIPLVDPAEMDAGGELSVGIVSISRDASFLAYSVRHGGEDSSSVEFIDVNQRKILPDRLPRGLHRGLAFSRHGNGFYYVHEALGPPRPELRAVNWHAFGTEINADSPIFSIEQDPKRHLMMFASQDSSYLGYLIVSLTDPRTVDFYTHNLCSGTAPQQIVKQLEGAFWPQFAGGKLIALTNWKYPNGRIVLIDPDDPGRDSWREIVPETKAYIQSFLAAGNLVFVSLVENGSSRVGMFDQSGNPCGPLLRPSDSTLRILRIGSDNDTLFYSATTFSKPPTILRHDTATGKEEVWAQSQIPFDSESIEVKRIEYVSKDGTKVPMYLASQKRLREMGSSPTFVTGYGGFGKSLTPQFTAYAAVLMEQGFLFAVSNLRGGSEFGDEWHLAGKRRNRQNAIDDFIAAAEWLLTHGYATPGKIAIGGGSNAGLLVGAALTQRPDLFRAVVCLGPLLDMVRYHCFDSAEFFADEYGLATNEDDFRHLYAYSPYHHVQTSVSYPAVMIISGDSDMRCNPMHARKMTARLQATNSERPILLDYKSTWGHTPVQPLSARIDALTDRLAFICHELA